MRPLCLLLLICQSLSGAIYYVRPDGNNSNTGLSNDAEHAWLTIGNANATVVGGDIVRVQAGTYNEKPSLSVSGSIGSWITYVADGSAICRGFTLAGSYVRIVGFEITHINTTYSAGITITGSPSYIEILDNYIHNTYGQAIRAVGGTEPSYVTIRGNVMYYIGSVDRTAVAALANSATTTIPNHWLIEYNTIQRSGDFADVYGTNVIVRNNYFHDFSGGYWDNGNTFHSDMFQPGSDGQQDYCRNQIYERNFCGDSRGANTHFGIWQDRGAGSPYGDTNIVLRGNVGYNIGSGGFGTIAVDHFCVYNNTLYKLCADVDGNLISWYANNSPADPCLAGLCVNNLIYDSQLSTSPIYEQGSGNVISYGNNIGYLAGSHASYVSTDDPLCVNPTGGNFRLGVGSAAIAGGTNTITVISVNGSGTSFDINDGQLLCDGWNMVDGDTITVGGTTTRVTGIVQNTVTVTDSVVWTQNMPVYWGAGSTVDIGAFPYGSTVLTAATLTWNGTTYTVTPTGDCRGVWFYVDGIPTTWVSSAPYSATIASGTVTAKAYALYAQATPIVNATTGSPSTSARWLPFFIK